MKKNRVFVHLLAFFMLSYSSAFGQHQSQQASVPKQVVKTQTESKPVNKLTSVAQKYLKKMEKSRNHHLREKTRSNHLSTKGKSQHRVSKMEAKKKNPTDREAPKLATDKRREQEVVKK